MTTDLGLDGKSPATTPPIGMIYVTFLTDNACKLRRDRRTVASWYDIGIIQSNLTGVRSAVRNRAVTADGVEDQIFASRNSAP
jgi:hypothetical protein